MDQRRALTDVGGSNDTPNMRSNDQHRYRVIADNDSTPDLVSAHAAPGDRLVYDVIDDDRWSLVRIERPVEGAEPPVQPPTREQIAALADESERIAESMERNGFETSHERAVAATLRALFPQPTPNAEPDTRAMQMTMADLLNQWDDVRHLNRCAINDWWYRRTSRHSLELQRLADEPVSIADMAPGMTVDRDSLMADLLRRRDKNGHLTIRDIERAFGAAPSIDETATRDVNPPPATPEEGS